MGYMEEFGERLADQYLRDPDAIRTSIEIIPTSVLAGIQEALSEQLQERPEDHPSTEALHEVLRIVKAEYTSREGG